MGFSRQEYWSQGGWGGCQVKELNCKKKNTGAGGHSLLQEIFLIQGSNPSLLHCRQIVYHWATRILQLHTYIYFICLMRYIYDYNWKWRVASQGWRILTPPLQSAVRVLLSSFQPRPSFSAHIFWLKCQALSLFGALGLSVWLTSLLQRKVHQTIHYRDLSGNTPYEQLIQNTSPVSMHFTP